MINNDSIMHAIQLSLLKLTHGSKSFVYKTLWITQSEINNDCFNMDA